MKRLLALGLVPALLVAILIGCARPPEPQQTAQQQQQQAQNTEKPSETKGDPEQSKPPKDNPTDQLTRDGLIGQLNELEKRAEEGSAKSQPSSGDQAAGKPGSGENKPDSGKDDGKNPGYAAGLVPGGTVTNGTVAPGTPGLSAPNFSLPSRGLDPTMLRAKKSGSEVFSAPKGLPGRPAEGKALPQVKLALGAKADPRSLRKLADGFDGSNAEKYGSYRENEFRSPLVAALSTFSADVNTASYSNVRRMLNQGTMPVHDSVFVAEFVNYFPYQYATPKGEDPVEFNLEMGPCPWNRKHHLVRVGVQAFQIPADKMPPRNLVFLIDTSGSMSSPNRLPLVKQALNLLIDQVGEKDRISVVTYAGDSRVALGPTIGTEKVTIKDVITNLQAQGSTNGEGGIKNAYRLARETFIDGGVNRVILCTDGDFNVGVTGQGELVKMIEEQRKSKVFLTILGFGMGNYKDETLKELANHGNGHHAYIDTLDEAKKLFVDQGGALVCVAKDVKFQVDFNPAKVAAYRLIGYENRLLKDEDFRNDAKDAGDMGSGHQVTVLYEIIPMGVAVDLPGVDKSKYTVPAQVDPKAPDEWLTVKMRYKHPEADVSKELSKPLEGKALGQELSDDFRFAAAASAFGMILRDSHYRGGMTLAGVVEEAQGCVKNDPGGHKKEFLELVKRARELSAPKPNAATGGSN